jgi:hypothetical protein
MVVPMLAAPRKVRTAAHRAHQHNVNDDPERLNQTAVVLLYQ